ncbi:MAG: Eco57I restriction-modification methylase domain-containing protein, partial [Aeriscardovia sp.]|nr:Eco57I restriction-modification methylase domain-containing protein [Aeriscardovia sp.]
DYVSLITPSRWFAGDGQNRSFPQLRRYMREREREISKMVYFPDENEVFKTAITSPGGIDYFLFDKFYDGLTQFTISYQGHKTTCKRPLFENEANVITVGEFTQNILDKVKRREGFISLSSLATGRSPFGIGGKHAPEISSLDPFLGSTPLMCAYATIRYIDPRIIEKGRKLFDSYKVFISKSTGHPGKDKGRILPLPYVALPEEACTDALIAIGCFDNLQETKNLAKYLKTKFLRFMVSLSKSSQNVYQNVYQFVPIQDFTDNSDIDWNRPLAEIDYQLYRQYELSEKEIEKIEETVSEMPD